MTLNNKLHSLTPITLRNNRSVVLTPLTQIVPPNPLIQTITELPTSELRTAPENISIKNPSSNTISPAKPLALHKRNRTAYHFKQRAIQHTEFCLAGTNLYKIAQEAIALQALLF
ncbi:conserved hypothetical protein [Ricinus communis]|uniref:Uncharacterized protein n=1 Tax=Ricinus communis TaxID=3988 RepID=B9SMH0_RICCO|nr:conserved hypothetical protein [Ricinus communis]